MTTFCVTTAAGLRAVYGELVSDTVLEKMREFAGALQNARLFVLDDALSMAPHSPTRETSAPALNSALNALMGSQVGGNIVILGDYRIFPAFEVSNPVADRSIDPDPTVLTDNPYGGSAAASVSSWLVPMLPVGRIAAGVSDSAIDFCNLLDRQIVMRKRPPARTGYVEFTSQQWQDSSAFVMSVMASPGHVLVSPDARVTSANANLLDCKFLYCNLHGFTNEPAWKGNDPRYGIVAPALTPDAFQTDYVAGTICFTEACYGLQIQNRPTSGSCCLSLLAAGAGGIIGSTGLAFGTSSALPQDLIDADALARGFFDAPAGTPLGSRMAAARQSLLRSSLTIDAFVQKTLLEFQLLGDPSYAV